MVGSVNQLCQISDLSLRAGGQFQKKRCGHRDRENWQYAPERDGKVTKTSTHNKSFVMVGDMSSGPTGRRGIICRPHHNADATACMIGMSAYGDPVQTGMAV